MAAFNGPGIRVLRQYQGQDGKTYVQLSTGETLDTDSDDYRDYYAEGMLYAEDERGTFYPQENAHEVLKQYQELTKNNSFENYMKPYFDDPITGSIAKGLGQSMDSFWNVNPSYKQNYDNEMRRKFAEQYLDSNPRGEDEARGTYLDRIMSNVPSGISDFILQSNSPRLQPTLWDDFSRGVASLGNDLTPEFLGGGNPGMMRYNMNDNSLTQEERYNKNIDLGKQGLGGFMAKSADQLGLFSPLAVPAKVVQSAYRPDYSFEDAIAGRRNDANLAEDIVTDPLTYAGLGASKSIPAISKIDESNLLKLALEEPKNLIPGRIGRTEEALKEANDWSRNWYTHPEFQRRANNIQNQFNDRFQMFIETADEPSGIINNAINEKKRVNGFWEQLKDNAQNVNSDVQFQSNRSKVDRLLSGEEHLHKGNAGVTYGEYSHPDKYLPMTSNGNQAFVNRALSTDNITSTGVHESNHIMATPRMLVEGRSGNLNRFFQEPFEDAIKKGLMNEYYSNPLEIYARTQEFRKFNNIVPGQKVTAEEVAAMKEATKKGSTIHAPFLRFKDKEMARLLNTLPAAGAGVGIPAWLLSQQ